jgi:protein-tyrosine phosphatase
MNPFHWFFDKLYPLIRFVYERIQGHAWFHQVTPHLWIGGAPTYDRDYEFILESGIDAVVNIRAERDDDRDFYLENGIDYLRLDVLDVMVPGPDELETGVAFIAEHVEKEQAVLVHCAKGRGRSATLLAAYLMSNEAMSYDQAQQLLISKRSLVNLQGRHRRVIESWIEARSKNGDPASSDPSDSGSSAGSLDS